MVFVAKFPDWPWTEWMLTCLVFCVSKHLAITGIWNVDGRGCWLCFLGRFSIENKQRWRFFWCWMQQQQQQHGSGSFNLKCIIIVYIRRHLSPQARVLTLLQQDLGRFWCLRGRFQHLSDSPGVFFLEDMLCVVQPPSGVVMVLNFSVDNIMIGNRVWNEWFGPKCRAKMAPGQIVIINNK